MADSEVRDDVDLHTRLLRTPLGRGVVGLIVLVGSFWIVTPNVPRSPVHHELEGWWKPAETIGLVQDWAVFSPNPRGESIDVRARVEHDDGTIEFWDVPEFDPGFGAYRQYRWHKWQERIRLDNRELYWPSTAEWIADQHLRDGARPARVTLIRRWIVHEPLVAGGGIVDSGWNEFEFYTWDRPA